MFNWSFQRSSVDLHGKKRPIADFGKFLPKKGRMAPLCLRKGLTPKDSNGPTPEHG